MDTKICSRCKKTLPATIEFFHKSNRYKNGFRQPCKECKGLEYGYKTTIIKNNLKVCKKCKRELPANDEYYYINNRMDGKLEHKCKECYGRRYKKTNKATYNSNGYMDGVYRRCYVCREIFELNENNFYKDFHNRSGFRYSCISCSKEQSKNRSEYVKEYAKTHRNEIREYNKKRRECSPSIILYDSVRGCIRESLRHGKKLDKTIKLLGCSINELKSYLESKFQDGMTWENYGRFGWHIDHVRPCASFDLTDLEQQKECFNYTNLQPLWWKDNIKKGSLYNGKKHKHNKTVQ